MLFNSYIFIIIFSITLILYYLLTKNSEINVPGLS